MSATTGIVALVSYAGIPTLGGKLNALLALLADPDTTSTTGAIAGGGYLDQMSPAAVTQLRVELNALIDSVTGGDDNVAYGQYTCVAADDTANLVDIVTGLAATNVSHIGVTISRAGSIVTADAAITVPSAGTIRVADGASTYDVTAGDVITWVAIDPAA